MSVAGPHPLPHSSLRWHCGSGEVLPTWFGLNASRPLTIDEVIVHHKSLQRLEQEFAQHRLQHEAEFRARTAYYPLPNKSLAKADYDSEGEILNSPNKLYNYTETKRDDEDYKYSGSDDSAIKASDLTVSEIDPLAVNSVTIYSSMPLTAIDELTSSKSVGNKNELILEPANVVNEDEMIHDKSAKKFSTAAHSKHAAHYHLEVPEPVALPIDPELRASALPELSSSAEDAERLEQERAAAMGAAVSGNTAALALVHAHQSEQSSDVHVLAPVDFPVAEPVDPKLKSEFQHEQEVAAHAAENQPPALLALGEHNALVLDEDNYTMPKDRAHIDTTHIVSAGPHIDDASNETDSQQPNSAPSTSLVKTRTLQLAELHENIIAQETAAARGPDILTIKQPPTLAPALPASKIQELAMLHLSQQLASGETHTVTEKLDSASAPKTSNRIAEMKRLHEEHIRAEREAKAQQDALFSGQLTNKQKPARQPQTGTEAVTVNVDSQFPMATNTVATGSAIAEMKRAHEAKIQAETDAKAEQDALFRGELTNKQQPTQTSSKSYRKKGQKS